MNRVDGMEEFIVLGVSVFIYIKQHKLLIEPYATRQLDLK